MATRNLSFLTTVAVAGTTTVCEFPTGENGIQRIGMTITNGNTGGGNPLDAFSINVRSGKSAVWSTLAGPTTTTDYSSPALPIIRVVGVPTTLAAAATAFILMDCHGISDVQITASAGTGTCPLSVDVSLG